MQCLCEEGILLPEGNQLITKEEMEYLDGGVSLAVSTDYLNKSNCLAVGRKYTAETGLSVSRIAKEVYAHAFMYYASPFAAAAMGATLAVTLGVVGVTATVSCLTWIRDHANPIDIGGDSDFRVSVYNAIWAVF